MLIQRIGTELALSFSSYCFVALISLERDRIIGEKTKVWSEIGGKTKVWSEIGGKTTVWSEIEAIR